MRTFVLSHLSDAALLRELSSLVARERVATAAVLAHIAEVDERRLFLPAGYSSMHAYCVGELRFTEDAALKRIQAARKARQFPAVFGALAEGRLHLSALVTLAPWLTEETVEELIAASAFKSKSEIEWLLVERSRQSAVAAQVDALLPAAATPSSEATATNPADQHAPGHVEPSRQPQQAPPAERRFTFKITVAEGTRDRLQYARELLSHQVPSGDVGEVIDRALTALIRQLEKRKFGATAKPRPSAGRPSTNPRHIPEHVKRAVWQRDGGQCTFVGENGHRCESRELVEFDHLDPVARGGQATVEGIRLRCRAHNQYEAERVFGKEFMRAKREQARAAKLDSSEDEASRRNGNATPGRPALP